MTKIIFCLFAFISSIFCISFRLNAKHISVKEHHSAEYIRSDSSLLDSLRTALVKRGYDMGPECSVVGNHIGTKSSLIKFQKDNNLCLGSLDLETLKALGLRR